MFLKPSAKPTPRCSDSPRLTLPAPPGYAIGSRPRSGSGSGSGIAAQRSSTSRAGALPVSTWPVGRTEPVCSDVAQPQLDAGRSRARRELVHRRLVREADLRRAEAAHRAARRVVRVDDGALDADVRHLVRAGGEGRGVDDDRGRGRRVCAAVEQQAHVGGDEPAVRRRPVADPRPRRVPVHVAVERLLAPVRHLHRAAACAARAGRRGSACGGPRASRTRRRRRRA